MNDIYNIGPFLISYKLISIVISGILGYITLLVVLKRTDLNKRLISDHLFTSVVILIIIWKFAVILFNFNLLLSNPLYLLYLQGNSYTLLLGLIISISYLIYKLYKLEIPLSVFKDSISYCFLIFLLIYTLFNPEYGFRTHLPWGITLGNNTLAYHPIHVYFAIILVIILLYLFKCSGEIGNGKIFAMTSSLIGIGGLLVTFLSPQLPFIWGISQKQWIYILFIFVGYLSTLKINEKKLKKQ